VKLEYIGNQLDGVDVPDVGITGWKLKETRDVPDEVARALLESGLFRAVRERAEKKEGE